MQTNHSLPQNTYIKILTAVTFALMLAIGAIGFWLSYEALRQVAQAHGKPGTLGAVWPLIIDLPIIAFSLAGVIAQTIGKSPRLPRAIVGLMTVVTVAYNWFHAVGPVDIVTNVVAVSVAIAAPLMYFAAFEVSLWLIDTIANRQPAAQVVTQPATVPAKRDKPVTKPAAQPDTAVTRRDKVAALLAAGKTQRDIAAALEVHPRTVARDIKALGVA